MLRAVHPPGGIEKPGDDPPQRNKEPGAGLQAVITRGGLEAARAFGPPPAVGRHRDLDRARAARVRAAEPDVLVNKAGKRLKGVQQGLNLQLNSWSPGRGLACSFFNSQATRPTDDQLFFCPPRARSRRLWAGAGERRRRASELSFAAPPVATRNGLAPPRRIGATANDRIHEITTWFTHKLCYGVSFGVLAALTRFLVGFGMLVSSPPRRNRRLPCVREYRCVGPLLLRASSFGMLSSCSRSPATGIPARNRIGWSFCLSMRCSLFLWGV